MPQFKECRISGNARPTRLTYDNEQGESLSITFYANGQAHIGIADRRGRSSELVVSNRAAHELRDAFNLRYRNATAVQ